jgi:hypothetical protein
MQRSTPLVIAGILLIVGSCLALVATLFIAFFTWLEYFVPSHYGSVRVITEPFYVELAIIVFELSAFVLGLLSAVNSLKRRKFSLSILGATFLLISGLFFFTNLLFLFLNSMWLPVESFGFEGLWSILQQYCGLPIIILASVSVVLLVSRKKEFKSTESNSSVTLEAILILSAISSASFAVFSIVPYEQAAGGFASDHGVATLIISICTFVFASLAALLSRKKKYFPVSIALMVLSLLSALSLSFIFMYIFPWIGSFVKGLVTESPIILLSVIALVLALLERKKSNQAITKSRDTLVNVS